MGMNVIAVIRLRGTVGIKPNARKTLESLKLKRKFSCIIVPENDGNAGMLQAAKDYIAFGKVMDEGLLKLLLEKRGRLTEGNGRLDGKNVDSALEAVKNGERLPKNMKNVFHLHPPTKGFRGRGIKTGRAQRGNLGKWEDGAIEELLRRMI